MLGIRVGIRGEAQHAGFEVRCPAATFKAAEHETSRAAAFGGQLGLDFERLRFLLNLFTRGSLLPEAAKEFPKLPLLTFPDTHFL